MRKSILKTTAQALLAAALLAPLQAFSATTGALTLLPNAGAGAGNQPYTATTDITGNYLYVGNYGDGTISAYSVNTSTGALSAQGPAFLGSLDPVTLTLTPNGRFFYSAGGLLAGFALDGAATPGMIPATAGGGWGMGAGNGPESGAVDGASRYFYLAAYGDAQIRGYAIDPQSGALSALPGSPYATAVQPDAVALTPSGQFLYVTSAAGGLYAYSVNGAGGFTPLAGSPFSTGGNPGYLVMDPSGRFLYFANTNDNTIGAYAINASTGGLTAVAGSPFSAAAAPNCLAMDPSGRFLYANLAQTGIAGYAINNGSGALTAVPGSPYYVNVPGQCLQVSANGKFLYYLDGNNNVDVYSINNVALSINNLTVGINTVNIGTNASIPGNVTAKSAGFYYGNSPVPSAANSTLVATLNASGFSATLPTSALQADTTYYVRPFLVTASGDTYLGQTRTFTFEHVLNPMPAPTLSGSPLQLQMQGSINHLHGEAVQKAGFAFVSSSTSQTPVSTATATVNNKAFSASTTIPVSGLAASAYIRPFITTATGNSYYGAAVAFDNGPLVQTVSVTDAGIAGMALSGKLNDTFTPKAIGFAYATTANPQTSNSTVAGKSSGSSFGAALAQDALTPGATYYVRAYATQADGSVLYGASSSFVNKLVLNNNSVAGLDNLDLSATLRSGLTAKFTGFLYGTSAQVSLSSYEGYVPGSATSGVFTAQRALSLLKSPGQTYYVVDEQGNVAYSNVTSFVNNPAVQLTVTQLGSSNGNYTVTIAPRVKNIGRVDLIANTGKLGGVALLTNITAPGTYNLSFGNVLVPNSPYTFEIRVYFSGSASFYTSNVVTLSTKTATLGQDMRGGNLVYLDSSGQHGLIAQRTNANATIAPLAKAQQIMSSDPAWRLPTLAELETLYNADKAGYITLTTKGGQTLYWSSDSCANDGQCPNQDYQWTMMMSSGTAVPQSPTKQGWARGVKTF